MKTDTTFIDLKDHLTDKGYRHEMSEPFGEGYRYGFEDDDGNRVFIEIVRD